MTSASSLAFPGSRTLATWWRQLAPLEPQALCVGHLFLHRLEAPACWREPQPLDPLLLLVLDALALDQKGPASPTDFFDRLHQRLNLDVPILRPLVRALADWHLIEAQTHTPDLGPSWLLNEQGYQALRTKSIWSRQWKRGLFPFVERLDPTGHRLAPPQFVKILDAPSSSWHVEEAAAFEVDWLADCLDQPPEWKKAFGFPLELVAFPERAPKAGAAVSWDRVVMDRAERLLVVFCQRLKPEEELLGFGVRPEGWVLNAAEPILRLPAAGRVIAPELERPASPDLWKHAWQTWCHMRTVPAAEVNECSLSKVEERLHIEAPEPLIQYLQAGRSDIFKGETWLLAGDGYVRQAARLDLVPK